MSKISSLNSPNVFDSASAETLLIGNRIPQDFFITQGSGDSDITVHAGSFHLALRDAGIERFNIMTYSSILPAIAKEVEKPKDFVHGSVMETIMAVASGEKGDELAAGISLAWLFDRKTGNKYGGIVVEEEGNYSEVAIRKSLAASVEELYANGFEEQFELKGIETFVSVHVPQKKFGTTLVSLCFTNYQYPIIR